MKTPIAIVGAGQMGSMLGYRLLKKGYKIRMGNEIKIIKIIVKHLGVG